MRDRADKKVERLGQGWKRFKILFVQLALHGYQDRWEAVVDNVDLQVFVVVDANLKNANQFFDEAHEPILEEVNPFLNFLKEIGEYSLGEGD